MQDFSDKFRFIPIKSDLFRTNLTPNIRQTWRRAQGSPKDHPRIAQGWIAILYTNVLYMYIYIVYIQFLFIILYLHMSIIFCIFAAKFYARAHTYILFIYTFALCANTVRARDIQSGRPKNIGRNGVLLCLLQPLAKESES